MEVINTRTGQGVRLRRSLIRNGAYWFSKRCIDVCLALLVLTLLSPLWLIIAVVIKLTSRGPVLYVEKREVGKDGKIFTLYKFRTMYNGNDNSQHKRIVKELIKDGNAPTVIEDGNGQHKKIYKVINDPRVTPVGRILRRLGLDEVPQFINVLRGEMSVVGPRPALYYEYELYEDWHKNRLSVLPGITGLYQVTARSAVTFDQMVRIDLEYIEKRSLWLDLKIMLLTSWVMITGKGAH